MIKPGVKGKGLKRAELSVTSLGESGCSLPNKQASFRVVCCIHRD